MSSGLPLCTDRSGAEISEGRNDTGTVYNCALINSGLSPLFHFRVFDHLPKHCLNIILVKYKCEQLHNLLIRQNVRSLNELLQHTSVTAKSVRPLGAGQMFYLMLLDFDLVLVELFSLCSFLNIESKLRQRFLFIYYITAFQFLAKEKRSADLG